MDGLKLAQLSGIFAGMGQSAATYNPAQRTMMDYLQGSAQSAIQAEAQKKAEKKAKKSGEKEFFAEPAAKAPLPAEYVENQKAVDAKLLAGLSGDLKGYLSTRFTLRASDRPHLMKF